MLPPPHDTLQRILDRLSQGQTPQQVIGELRPRHYADVLAWARRLAGWDEHRGEFPAQAVALARVISRRAMREFGLALTEDGRVVEEKKQQPFGRGPDHSFPLQLGNDTIPVKHEAKYFPWKGTDLFSFIGDKVEPPPGPGTVDAVLRAHKPHALSDTGWLSHYCSHDAVEAAGGPEAYARLFADARLAGQGAEFEAIFEGRDPEQERSPRKKPAKAAAPPPPAEQARPVLGEHTAAQVAREGRAQESPGQPPRQRQLFD